jgi:hypothetical protein
MNPQYLQYSYNFTLRLLLLLSCVFFMLVSADILAVEKQTEVIISFVRDSAHKNI